MGPNIRGYLIPPPEPERVHPPRTRQNGPAGRGTTAQTSRLCPGIIWHGGSQRHVPPRRVRWSLASGRCDRARGLGDPRDLGPGRGERVDPFAVGAPERTGVRGRPCAGPPSAQRVVETAVERV